MTNNDENKHNLTTIKIASRPKLVGLDGVMLSASNVCLWDTDGRQLAEIDDLFIHKDYTLDILEYKQGSGYKGRAVEQLHRAKDCLYQQHISLMMALHNVNRMLYVSGHDLRVEEIK